MNDFPPQRSLCTLLRGMEVVNNQAFLEQIHENILGAHALGGTTHITCVIGASSSPGSFDVPSAQGV